MLSIAVLGSGRGSNFGAILAAIDAGELAEIRVACVLSDVRDAPILELGRQRGVPAFYVDPGPFKSKLAGAAEQQVLDVLAEHEVQYVVLAGFMRIVATNFLQAYPLRILNIHPALLPAFPGLAAWQQALDYGVKVTGCTVHFVDAGVDQGPIILQRTVPVLADDTAESLHARIQDQEHKAYPLVLKWLAAGLVRVKGRRVFVPDDR